MVWFVSDLGTEFGSDVDKLVIDYVRSKWTETSPALAPLTPTDVDKRNKVIFGENDPPSDVTYYIQVTEGNAEISSHEIRKGLYTYIQDINFDAYARRLQPRENFPHLNNMVNHLMKIFGTFVSVPVSDIPGIEAVKLKRLSPFHTPRLTHVTNLYHRTLTIELTYYRQS